MVKRTLIYGFTGLFFEILWTGFCSLIHGDMTMSAHTSFIMLPIYGMVVLLEPLFNIFRHYSLPPVLRGIFYAVLIFACEYFSGMALRLFGICPWKYTGIFSINGLIRLDYAPLWFTAGLVYEKLYFYMLSRFGDKSTANQLKGTVQKAH